MILRQRKPGLGRRIRKQKPQFETLEKRIVLDSTVVFNEIMYNPVTDGEGELEWIELFNQLNLDMDISEWVLSGGVEYTFPDKTIVPGRGYLLVAADPAALESEGISGALGPWTGSLSNEGEELRLYNNDERLMNVVDYDDTNGWPEGADGLGPSLSKSDEMHASHLVQNWTASLELGGTPGGNNFVTPGTFRSTNIVSESAPVKAIVPSDGSLGTDWVQPEFDDSGWTSGNMGVGYDSRTDYKRFFGLDLDEPPNGQDPMPMKDVNGSIYMRVPFELAEDASFDRMRLRIRYDDGFVAYLNGVEVVSDRAPGRDGNEGELVWNSTAPKSHSDRLAITYVDFDLTDKADLLKTGNNVLALHGMNRSLTDSDLLFDILLVGDTEVFPKEKVPLAFNEVAAHDAENFFVEITNTGTEPVNLNGVTLQSTDGSSYSFGDEQLAPGALVARNESQLGFRPGDTDRIGIFNAAGDAIADARRVTGRLRGASTAHNGDWLYPNTATPGSENSFDFETNVVINEIMYHAHPELANATIPAQYDRNDIVPMDNVWRYNASGAKLPNDWAQQEYTVGENNWGEGAGLLGAETSNVGYPLNTEFPRPSSVRPSFATYYFQTDFELSAEEITALDVLEINHVIDDGAIFYLNGEEFLRFNLPDEVDTDTYAPRSIRNAERQGPVAIDTSLLRPGKNVFSAEVHIRNASDSDIVFGASLATGVKTADSIPGTPFREITEGEWIELYNKGSEAVDLTDWQIEGGISFSFDDGTKIGPGEYLVISSDAEYLSQQYPDIRIIGDFNGRLSDHDDRILLVDANNNPADDVHYYEGGTNWPSYPDGGAVSLELTDPNADNSKGPVWAASDDTDEVDWVSHTFRGKAVEDIYGTRALFNEFAFGLLSRGEFLIDDVKVVQDPDGEAVQLIQNGTFESDTLGNSPDKWRLIGNHSGTVVTDPEDAGNKVLHMIATGAQSHVHDHAETTFIDNTRIATNEMYEISFRARWLRGNSQINSRLWLGRLSNTLKLDVPERSGTPGAANSTLVDNTGPTYSEFGHSPVTPLDTESVTVSARATDPDNVNSMTLHWRVDKRSWNSVPMTMDSTGLYQAEIPPHEEGTMIHFYVEGTDGKGVTSTYPADGADARAAYQVEDDVRPRSPIDLFRLVLLQDEERVLFDQTNRMSNQFRRMTLIHLGKAYYDVEVRQTGSRWIRPNSGYKVKMNPDQMFYGVHDSIRFDLNGMAEIVMKQMINRAGKGKTSAYDDAAYLAGPNRGHNHEVILQLARYENLYLNEQFENGSDGTKYELDDVTVSSQPRGGIEGLKVSTEVNTGRDIGGNTQLAMRQGANPEFYRPHILIKSNRAKDDFESVVRMALAIHTDDRSRGGMDLFEKTNAVMDVDLWMRHYANQSYFGNWDTYGFRRPKNLRMYVRPSDNRMIPFFWDCDLCNFSEPVTPRREITSRLDEIRTIPHNMRLFWGHMHDYITTSFNEEYVSRWAGHYGEMFNNATHGGDETFSGIVASTRTRSSRTIAELEKEIPPVDFSITTNDGQDFTTDEGIITLEGEGWVNVRQLRLAGSDQALDAFWRTANDWTVRLPLSHGANTFQVEAIDYSGNLIGMKAITITSTSGDPATQSLRVSEINYNPADPTAVEISQGHDSSDDFEFVEFTNTGDVPIPLNAVQLVRATMNNDEQGVAFDFSDSAVQELAAGASVVVVEDIAAFRQRYGNDVSVAGQWSGGLSNNSEMLTVEVNGLNLQQFTYEDNWYPSTDGEGRTLQIVDASHSDLSSWGQRNSWRPSGQFDGTPGTSEPVVGDANNDGVFSSEDLVAVLQAGEYQDAETGNSTFSEGDWNGDGDFTSSDFVWAFKYGNYREAEAGVAAMATDASIRNLSADDVAPLRTRALHTVAEDRARTTHRSIGQQVRLDYQTVDSLFELPSSNHEIDTESETVANLIQDDQDDSI